MEGLPVEIRIMVFEHAFAGRIVEVNNVGKPEDAEFNDLIISKTLYETARETYLSLVTWEIPSLAACKALTHGNIRFPKLISSISVNLSDGFDNLDIIRHLATNGCRLQRIEITGCTIDQIVPSANMDSFTAAFVIQGWCSVDTLSNRACQKAKTVNVEHPNVHRLVQTIGDVKTLGEVRIHINECECCEFSGLECGHLNCETQLEQVIMTEVKKR